MKLLYLALLLSLAGCAVNTLPHDPKYHLVCKIDGTETLNIIVVGDPQPAGRDYWWTYNGFAYKQAFDERCTATPMDEN